MSQSKRGSVDYSAADSDIGYTSTASNSTFIPPYPISHGQRFVSPTNMYEGHNNGIATQVMVATGQENVQSPEHYVSSGGVVAANSAGSTAQNSSAQYRRAPPATPPVPLACTECRLRHLKCDAGVPTCGRCRAEGRSCCYVKSRRGWKGRKRKGSTAASAGGMTSGTEASETGKGESGGEGGYVGKFEISLLHDIAIHTRQSDFLSSFLAVRRRHSLYIFLLGLESCFFYFLSFFSVLLFPRSI